MVESDQDQDQPESYRSDVGRFAMVPLWLIEAGVSARAVQVFAVIAARFADRDTNEATPGRRAIAEMIGCKDRQTVTAAIDELVQAGAISRRERFDRTQEHKTQLSNEYRIHYAKPIESPSRLEQGRGKESPRGRGKNPPRGRGMESTRGRGNKSAPKIQNHIQNQIPEEASSDAFALSSEQSKALTTHDALKAFYQGWADRYHVAPDRGKSDPGKMKTVCEARGVEAVIQAIGEYFADDSAYVVNARHPLGLFVTSVGRLIATAAKTGRPAAPAMGDGRRCTHQPTCRTFAECFELTLAEGRAQGVA